MPVSAPHPCAHPGCAVLVTRGSRCQRHVRQKRAAEDERRGTSTERGYDHRWRAERRRYLQLHPLCVMCQASGRLRPATVVDHVIPHRGNESLFWDQGNWQALCKPHHDGAKQRMERGAG